MKNLFKYSIGVLFAGLTMTACSPDDFDGADANGLPNMSGVDFNMTVDQETNQMIANIDLPKGTYPIWIIDGTSYSTLSEVGYKNAEQGTHSIELKLGNRNGFSQSSVSKTFTFNETKVDWTADLKRIADKEWRFANKEQGHLGCGEPGSAGVNWWSAAPDEKIGTGLYDDRITFTADNANGGTYTYNSGADGMTYINKGVTVWGTQNDDGDLDVHICDEATADWTFATGTDPNGESAVYIQLAANTPFPYITADGQYANPRFRIESLTAKKMALIYDGDGIAWHYIFTSEEAEATFNGFDANSDFNMWKGITPSMSFYYNPDPNWGNEQSAVLEETFQGGNNDYTFTINDECFADWQAQVHFHTDLNTNAATHYDFSCILNADQDINGVIIKLTDEADADFIFEEHIDLKAGEDYILWKSDLEGKDLTQVKLATDYGHATGKTTINLSNIVLKDHANDDGTKLPSEEPGTPDTPAVVDWNTDSPANLWAPVETGDAFVSVTPWFADDNWGQIADPEWSHKDGVWELTIPEGIGGSQWQGQFPINTTLTASMDKKYNFYCVVESDEDLNGVTIKFTETDDAEKHDQNFFFANQHNIKADQEFVYKAEGVSLPQNDAHAMSLFFDFGGAPVGAHIKISKIYFEEATVLSYDDENNLWKAVDAGDAFISVTPWFADDNWSQIGDPDWKHSGSEWSLTIPEGMGGSQWQGQFPINTTLATAQNDAYNFQVTLTADEDINGVTIKLTETDDAEKHDNNFYFADQHNLKADEPYVYTMKGVTLPLNDAHALSLFFDFGGAAAGTNIVIKDIIFEKAE